MTELDKINKILADMRAGTEEKPHISKEELKDRYDCPNCKPVMAQHFKDYQEDYEEIFEDLDTEDDDGI